MHGLPYRTHARVAEQASPVAHRAKGDSVMPLVDFGLPDGKSWDDQVMLTVDLQSSVLIIAALSHYIETLDEEMQKVMDAPLTMSALAEMAGMQSTRQALIATSINVMEQAMPDIVEEAAQSDPKVAAMRDKWKADQAAQAEKA